MTREDRLLFDHVLRRARISAYAPGEFVGQESFMQGREILSLATEAGIGPGTSVLDLCCGVAGPGALITAELGCTYQGVDANDVVVAMARRRCAGLCCRFEVARIPPVPDGPFDVVLLLETFLAFRDKKALLRGIAAALRPGGRLAFTVEEGHPLSAWERTWMPNSDTVWLVPLRDLLAELEEAGLHVRWVEECSESHRATVGSLIDAFAAEGPAIAARLGHRALHDLVLSHRLWKDWLRSGRVRKFALVAEKTTAHPTHDEPQDR